MAIEPEKNQRVTQKDVARAAGVSHVTVSMALRGSHEISPATRKNVQAIAARLGYSPDPMLKALSSYRSSLRPAAYRSNLALLINHPVPQEFYQGSETGLYFKGARQRAEELGYRLEPIHLAEMGGARASVQRILAARGISALLVAPLHRHDDHIDLDWNLYSAVRFGYSMRDTPLHTVTNCQYRSSYSAVENLVRLGYQRIGFISQKSFNLRSAGNFLGGFLAASAMLEVMAAPVLGIDLSSKSPDCAASYKEDVLRWLKQHKPDAVLIPSGYLHSCLQQWGVRVPDDVALASLAVGEDERVVSGMNQNSRNVGRAAVDVLVSLLEKRETGIPQTPMHVLIDGVWMDGRTTHAPKKKRKRGGRNGAAELRK